MMGRPIPDFSIVLFSTYAIHDKTRQTRHSCLRFSCQDRRLGQDALKRSDSFVASSARAISKRNSPIADQSLRLAFPIRGKSICKIGKAWFCEIAPACGVVLPIFAVPVGI